MEIERLSVDVVKAVHEDVSEICEIANSYKLDALPADELGVRGFLVSNFSDHDYRQLVLTTDFFFVAKHASKIVGFLVAYSSECIRPEWIVDCSIRDQYPGSFVVTKQICVAADYTGRGIAKQLYSVLFSSIANRPVFAAIVLDPENRWSVQFHERLGFTKVQEMHSDDRMLRGIWRRPADIDASIDTTNILIEQYKVYVDLYKHEDNLTWDKLHKLILLSGVLFAAFGVVLKLPADVFVECKTPDQGLNLAVASFIAFSGAVLSGAFFFTIGNSTLFLALRRHNFRNVEKTLVARGALDIASSDTLLLNNIAKERGFLPTLSRRVITPGILIKIPVFLFVIWIVLLVLTLVLFFLQVSTGS